MNLLQAFVLGAVQGLGEFLPISSSAHLVLTPWVFGWKDQGLGFDVALHWGTLLAVLYYFRSDLWPLIKGFWHSLFKETRNLENNIYQKLPWLLLLASIPGAAVGYLLESQAETVFRNPMLIAINLAVFGVIIFVVDRFGKKEKNLDRISWKNALGVGFSQALAIVPGVSRSGATMAAGLLVGFKRQDAARFSFLMSVPIIFGAGLVNIKNIGAEASHGYFWVGFCSAAIFGFLSIKYLLRYLAKHDFKVFTWYRVLLAGLILGLYFVRM